MKTCPRGIVPSLLIFFISAAAQTNDLTGHPAQAVKGEVRLIQVDSGGTVMDSSRVVVWLVPLDTDRPIRFNAERPNYRSEEHTSELQSQSNLVCRLLLEKKKKKNRHIT